MGPGGARAEGERTVDEFKAYIAERVPGLTDVQLDAIAAKVDEDGDGVISEAEFEGGSGNAAGFVVELVAVSAVEESLIPERGFSFHVAGAFDPEAALGVRLDAQSGSPCQIVLTANDGLSQACFLTDLAPFDLEVSIRIARRFRG